MRPKWPHGELHPPASMRSCIPLLFCERIMVCTPRSSHPPSLFSSRRQVVGRPQSRPDAPAGPTPAAGTLITQPAQRARYALGPHTAEDCEVRLNSWHVVPKSVALLEGQLRKLDSVCLALARRGACTLPGMHWDYCEVVPPGWRSSVGTDATGGAAPSSDFGATRRSLTKAIGMACTRLGLAVGWRE